jgi:hypothetical protein
MKKYLAILLFVLATLPLSATSYFLAANGSDSNNGTSTGTPWLSANHAVNCGDTITAAASSSYSGWNFWEGNWGVVTGSGHCFATLKCATFDACVINASSGTGSFWVDKSHWMILGFEVQGVGAASQAVACFTVAPNTSTPAEVYDVVFADDIANGCYGSGFNTFNNGTTHSVDYVALVGDIAYNAAQGNVQCYSGFGIYQPIAQDSLQGTHIYLAGNFSYGNFDPATCGGGSSTDGEGIIIDTLDFSQGSGTAYTQQVVVNNNIVVGNGSFGIEVFNNQAGTIKAPVYILQNTAWGDLQDPNETKLGAGELTIITTSHTEAYLNLVQTKSATGLGGNAVYALAISAGDATDHVYNSYASGVSGNNTFIFSSGSFAYGPNNTIGTTVTFANATVPGAPSCSTFASTTACMATVIANFVPTAATATTYGYQTPSTTNVFDPLYPSWLCSTNLPTGLVTPGCLATPDNISGTVLNAGSKLQ